MVDKEQIRRWRFWRMGCEPSNYVLSTQYQAQGTQLGGAVFTHARSTSATLQACAAQPRGQ